MTAPFELWSGADTAWTVVLSVAVVVAVIAVPAAFIAWANSRMWKGRCALRDGTIAGLEAALDDGRLTMLQRRHPPSPVHSWGHTRQHHQRRSMFPGHNTGPLPFDYGHQAPPLDPCLAPVDDLTWLTEPQPQSWPVLDVEGLLIARLIGALENPTTELRVVDTQEMEMSQ